MESKEEVRRRVWRILRERGVARFPFPIEGRIPNFVGAEKAARRLAATRLFRDAEVVFCNPDSPQRPVRELALRAGKTLVMATPRLRRGFLVLEPGLVPEKHAREASTIRGAFKWGRATLEPPPIDLKVTGSVAVDRRGGRVGKGGGYSDLEYAILREMGLVGDETPVVTTVHDLQVVARVPRERHDVPVDHIFTPTRWIETRTPYPKPSGVYWEALPREKIELIPLLRRLAVKRGVYR